LSEGTDPSDKILFQAQAAGRLGGVEYAAQPLEEATLAVLFDDRKLLFAPFPKLARAVSSRGALMMKSPGIWRTVV
jgi:hypothetical protein